MNCCKEKNKNKRRGFLVGLIYGLLPHTFCIAFIIFTILGTTTATVFLRPFLLSRHFFFILIGLSFVFATISAVIYLKKSDVLSFSGIKRKKGYLLTLYGITIGINLLLFMIIFPMMTNISFGKGFIFAISNREQVGMEIKNGNDSLDITVDIPCSGHSFLITNDLKRIKGVENVRYSLPNFFSIDYNPQETNQEEIFSLEVFNIYPATIIYK